MSNKLSELVSNVHSVPLRESGLWTTIQKKKKKRNTKYLREQRCRNDTSVQTYEHKKTKTKHIFKGERAQKRLM